MTHALTPTDEQTYILDLTRTTGANLMIRALAGTGKTATLKMIEAAAKERPILVLAFNKKIATDAQKTMASTTTVRTFNSLGHRIWAKTIGKNFKPDARKVGDIYRAMIDEAKSSDAKRRLWDAYWPVMEAVGMAKSIGYIPPTHALAKRGLANWIDLTAAVDEVPDEFTLKQINAVLLRSIALAYQGTCDFDDQIYMPTLFAGAFPEFPLVMVDEYQDLNPVNHEMIRKLVKHRLIGVGDHFQSIYGFRGADPTGMTTATKAFAMTECDLSISFRCPEAVVRNVRWRVPHFRWSKTGGHVETLRDLSLATLEGDPTFICRNNAPLFSLGMRMLSTGHSVNVSGSDIGPRLVRQMKKLGPEAMPRAELLSTITNWQSIKTANGSRTAKDTADCMRVFTAHGDNLGQALVYADHLFKQEGRIHLTTGHKAKGLEYPTVYHLDPFLLGESEQDRNLAYVIGTRSSDRLFTINSDDIN